jgi:superfamily II DNA/RNA helicase
LFHILERQGHPVARIHSDRSQGKRVQALSNFRTGSHRILVATDIAGRGIDVPGIEHVINFDIPETVEDYVHRGGRTARGAAIGIVSTIATWQDIPMVRKIEESLGDKLPRCTVPAIEAWEELERPARRVRTRV